MLWQSSLGGLPKKEEIEAIMSYAAHVTADEWDASGHGKAYPGITSELSKAGGETYDCHAKLRNAERELAIHAPMSKQPEPVEPVLQMESTSDALAPGPEKKRRKKMKAPKKANA